jgi:hypothetical protein
MADRGGIDSRDPLLVLTSLDHTIDDQVILRPISLRVIGIEAELQAFL